VGPKRLAYSSTAACPARGGTIVAVVPRVTYSFDRWLTFAGFVLVVAALYWAQPVLVPIALAMLITFVLTPPARES
jgi:predicted PurR-regulated permease PerM